MSSLTKFKNEKIVQNTINLDNIKIYLFVEDIEEYIEINSIKIDINEESRGYYFNNSINIDCQLNKNVITHALNALKYNKLIYESKHSRNPKTGRLEIHKKDIVSDVILYVLLNDNLIKILEFKNLMILSYNEMEYYNIQLTCDHYLMFSDIQSIKNEQYLRIIYNKIGFSCNKSYEPYLNIIDNIPDNCNRDNCIEDDDWDDWDDLDDYKYTNDNNNQNLFQKSIDTISNIFSKFYK